MEQHWDVVRASAHVPESGHEGAPRGSRWQDWQQHLVRLNEKKKDAQSAVFDACCTSFHRKTGRVVAVVITIVCDFSDAPFARASEHT